MSKAKDVIIFAIGAMIGAGVATYAVKEKYARIAQEEIDSVKEVFSKQDVTETDSDMDDDSIADPTRKVPEKPDIEEYAQIVKSNGYTNYSDISKPVKVKEDEPMPDEPYIIAPEAYDEIDDYDPVSLTYYADGVLTDEQDVPLEDVQGTVGDDWIEVIKNEDSAYVRNDRLKADFEILRDEQTYAEVSGEDSDAEE